ncbi:MAG: hypothetical protein KDA84_13835, partial [Planctomycetaceae bacterium]|nr:hypothetical protein [Planctomycetaceae bacterium]
VFHAPLIPFPPQAAGAAFLEMLGEVYDSEEELHRQWLVRNAQELKTTLEHPQFPEHPNVARFLPELDSLLEFLQSLSEDVVAVFSSDRRPAEVFRETSD